VPDQDKINNTRTWNLEPQQVEAISKCIAIIEEAKEAKKNKINV